MDYDFDKFVDRKNTFSLKYDFYEKYAKPADALPMWVADMDIPSPPEVVEALKERANHGIFGYSMPTRTYFEVVADWFKTRHGWNADPDKFICTPGVVFALCTLIRAVTKEGDGVLCCQPVYYPFATSIENNFRRVIVSELTYSNGKYGVDFEDFERKIVVGGVKAFILCNPHNPVGRVWTREELLKMAEICLKHGVFVISDEIHADFTFAGHKHICYPTLGERFEKSCAVCTAPSKSFNLAGLQISNIYIPDRAVRKKFEDELDKMGYWEPNIMGMTACMAAYSKCALWLDELKNYLAANLDFVRNYLAENIPQIKLVEPEGTYLLWLDCMALGLNNSELSDFFSKRAGLWLDDGYIFGAGGQGFERMNIACPKEVLSKALKSLSAAVKNL